MNNWKEQANLFANGEFAVRVDYGAETEYWKFDHKALDGIWETNLLPNSTLIARRIEDMKEEECNELRDMYPLTFNVWPDDALLTVLRSASSRSWSTNIEIFLYLLSIGVYPFDQSHFDLPDDDPAKVIDINEISHE